MLTASKMQTDAELRERTQALRYNEGKPQWGLVDFNSLEPMIRVLEMGAKKYAPFNWKQPMDITKILESAQRHLAATFDGEFYDKESQQLHIAHVMCNCMFWIYHFNKQQSETPTQKSWKELEYELLFGKKNETSGTNAQVQQPAGSGGSVPQEFITLGGVDYPLSGI